VSILKNNILWLVCSGKQVSQFFQHIR